MSPLIERLIGRLEPGTSLRPPDDGRKRAAVAIVLHDASDGARVLLMKRAARQGDPWSGHIALPGGGFDARDGDLLQTAIREADEELGIALAAERLLGNLPALSPMSSGPAGMEVTPFVFVAREQLATQPGPEAEVAFWLPLGLAASGALDGTYTYPGTERTFSSWTYEGHVIWGLTWRIISEMMTI